MVTQWKGLLFSALAGVLLGAQAAPARGDEIQYLPDGTHIVVSVNFKDVLATKTFAEMKKQFKLFLPVQQDLEAELSKELGIPTANIARLTMGVALQDKPKSGPNRMVGIATTAKPVVAADIIAAKKPPKYKKNVTYKDAKAGTFTIHTQQYQFQFKEKDEPGKVQEGDSFCVAEANVVLFGRGDALRQVLERNKNPELSANLRTGLKHAGFNNAAVVLIDLQKMPARERFDMFRGLGVAALNDIADDLHTLALKANEDGKITASATLFSKDAARAAEAKKIIEDGLADFKAKLKDDLKLPAEFKEMIKAARDLLDVAKVSAKGNQTSVEVSTEPATAGRFAVALIMEGGESSEPAKEVKELKNGK